MINPFFYYSTIRKLIVAFSDLFNNVNTMDSNGTIHTVPIYFATQNKMLFRYRQARKKIILPVFGFVPTEQSFDNERQKNKLNKIYTNTGDSGSTTFNMIREKTAYNFGFTLSIWSKYLQEFYQIIEQITVNFKPHLNTSIKLLNEDEMEIIIDVPVILDSITYNMEFVLNETEDRVLKADLNFTMKACLFPFINQNIEQIQNISINMNRWEDDELINQILL